MRRSSGRGLDPCGLLAGDDVDDRGHHLGRRDEGGAVDLHRQPGLGAPLGEDGEAAIGLGAGAATIRSATSRWNIRVSDFHQGGQASPPSQRTSKAVPTL